MDAKITGKIILDRRRALGLTQVQLAQKLNISNRAISKWENGDGLPDISLLPELSKELGITIDELLTGVKPEKEIEYITIQEEKPEEDFKKAKSKLLISEIIAFSLCCGAVILGSATEIFFFHKPLFYAFIEIYLIIGVLALLIVSSIVMLTALVRFNTDSKLREAKQYLIIYLFFLLSSISPACVIFRGLSVVFRYGYGYFYRYIFAGLYFIAIVVSMVYFIKKYKEMKNEKNS